MESVIVGSVDVDTFFEEAVRDAARARGYDPDAPGALYLSGVLSAYARPEWVSRAALEQPLSLALAEALHTVGAERFSRLRGLGDHVLYVSGFFAPHLETRGVEVRYVTSLGARAYDNAGRMLRGAAGDGAPDLFFELAENFERFADLLNSVAEKLSLAAVPSSTAVLKLYERWLKTGSQELGSELMERGVLPTRGAGGLH